ncbi:hypothetical protein BH09MYX1_BH09MYX1_62870 [soil metagenome]
MSRISLSLISSATVVLFACGTPSSTFTPTPDGGTGDTGAIDAASDSELVTLTDATADVGPVVPLGDVDAVVTCDNAYGFGWGDVNKLDTYNTAPASVVAGDIFNCKTGPEGYTIPAAQAPASAYVYAVAWADHSVTQGLIGQFKRKGASPLYTGDAKWEVCATGIDFDSSDPNQKLGPSLVQINTEIGKCNGGTGDKSTSRGGWVNSAGAVTAGAVGKLAIGQDNSKSYNPDFPIICQSGGADPGVDDQARWMWYSASGSNAAFHFSSLSESRPFLVFRLAAKSLPPPPN